jgi:hypothetical protein
VSSEIETLEYHFAGVVGIVCLIIAVFYFGGATDKESHAWTPSVGRRWHQLFKNLFKSMLGRHLLGEGGIRCLKFFLKAYLDAICSEKVASAV